MIDTINDEGHDNSDGGIGMEKISGEGVEKLERKENRR